MKGLIEPPPAATIQRDDLTRACAREGCDEPLPPYVPHWPAGYHSPLCALRDERAAA